jgi:alkylation response protein AidB-like acyl-CoA dehydrogenase
MMPDLTEVTKALAARAEHYDRTASFPADSIAAIHDAGLLTATVHERYGGPGARLVQTALILRALGQGDPWPR